MIWFGLIRTRGSAIAAAAATLAISMPTSAGDTGACCVELECSIQTEHACMELQGIYLGDGTICMGNPCLTIYGDTCETAVQAWSGPNPFDTTLATDSAFGDPDESQCEDTFLDWDASPDRWLYWVAPGNGTVSFDTCDVTSYDTSLVLYAGTDCAELVQIACNGDADDLADCQDYVSHIPMLPVISGETFYVRIGGWQAAQGAGTLNITFDGTNDPEAACCVGQACVFVTQAYCQAIGGEYLGDGTTCAGNPCAGDPTGACCIGTSCTTQTQVDCAAAEGTYHGDGSNCDPSPCTSIIDIGWRVVGIDRTSLDQPHYTLDVYLEMPVGHRLDAVAGNVNQHKLITSSGGFFQETVYGGPTSVEVNAAFYSLVPDLEWDSRVTIGTLDSSGDPWSGNELSDIGIDWALFESGGPLDVANGTWYVLPTHEQGQSIEFTGQDCGTKNGVLIARLTTMGLESEVTIEGLFQGRTNGGATWQEVAAGTIVWQGEVDCNENQMPDACDIASGQSEDDNDNGIPDECESECPGDADGDGDADVDDILTVIAAFGAGSGGDLDGDGDTDVDDLLTCIAAFGGC